MIGTRRVALPQHIALRAFPHCRRSGAPCFLLQVAASTPFGGPPSRLV